MAKDFLGKVLCFVVSSNYIKYRIWGLGIVLIFLAIFGQLFSKTALIATFIILGYTLLTYIFGRSENRD